MPVEVPLTGIKIDLTSDRTKNHFIDAETAKALLEACPDQEWRVIFALTRYGGLRCPSEVLSLRWSDINWERERFKVHSSKTERSGKGERVVPLFPELRQELEDLAELVQPGVEVPATDKVIKRYHHTEQNLRKALHRIADHAGVERWQNHSSAFVHLDARSLSGQAVLQTTCSTTGSGTAVPLQRRITFRPLKQTLIWQ